MTLTTIAAPAAPEPHPGKPHAHAGTIRHPLFAQALGRCLELLGSPADTAFVFLVGASGAGKTHLVRVLHRELLASFADLMASDPDVIPVLRMDTPAPVDGSFRFRTFGSRLFEEARLPGRGRPSLPRTALPDPLAARARTYGKTIDEILGDAVGACRDRGVRVIILDESGHLANVTGHASRKAELDVLKAMAQDAGVRFVLAGPYELLDFRDASTQLGRRSRLVELGPYDVGDRRHAAAWQSLVVEVAGLAGLELPEGHDWSTYLHAGSLGCVGLLRDWLVEAGHAYRVRGGASSALEVIAEYRRSAGQLAAIADELRQGLARLATDIEGPPAEQPVAKAHRAPLTLNGQLLKPGEPAPKRRRANHGR